MAKDIRPIFAGVVVGGLALLALTLNYKSQQSMRMMDRNTRASHFCSKGLQFSRGEIWGRPNQDSALFYFGVAMACEPDSSTQKYIIMGNIDAHMILAREAKDTAKARWHHDKAKKWYQLLFRNFSGVPERQLEVLRYNVYYNTPGLVYDSDRDEIITKKEWKKRLER